MKKRDHLKLVGAPEPEAEESLGTLMIKNTVNLVVARAAIRVHRHQLISNARVCRTLQNEAHSNFPDENERVLAIGVLHGKQLAYREAAKMLRGLDA